MDQQPEMEAGVERAEGIHLTLRLVQPVDANYIYGLRNDPKYNAHLSSPPPSIEAQRAWIERYKRREASGEEYYYVIERRKDQQPCGLVRLYQIEETCFTWGSWILDANKPPKAALESAVLSLGIGFERLGKRLALIDVRRDNTRALAFYRRLGMTETGADRTDCYFEYPAERYLADRDGLVNIVRRPESSGTREKT